jgi:5'-3' exonuclease
MILLQPYQRSLLIKDLKPLILTGDRDLLQLVRNDLISVIAPVKGVSEVHTLMRRKVIEEYGSGILQPQFCSDIKLL